MLTNVTIHSMEESTEHSVSSLDFTDKQKKSLLCDTNKATSKQPLIMPDAISSIQSSMEFNCNMFDSNAIMDDIKNNYDGTTLSSTYNLYNNHHQVNHPLLQTLQASSHLNFNFDSPEKSVNININGAHGVCNSSDLFKKRNAQKRRHYTSQSQCCRLDRSLSEKNYNNNNNNVVVLPKSEPSAVVHNDAQSVLLKRNITKLRNNLKHSEDKLSESLYNLKRDLLEKDSKSLAMKAAFFLIVQLPHIPELLLQNSENTLLQQLLTNHKNISRYVCPMLDVEVTDYSEEDELECGDVAPQSAPTKSHHLHKNSKRFRLSESEKFLTRRAKIHANWSWTNFELISTEYTIRNLELIRYGLLKKKRRPPEALVNDDVTALSSTLVNTHTPLSQPSCSRVQVIPRKHLSHIRKAPLYITANDDLLNILNPAIGWDFKGSDPFVKCQCHYPEKGPCILCLGQWHSSLDSSDITRNGSCHREVVLTNRSLCSLDMSFHASLSSLAEQSPLFKLERRLHSYNCRNISHWSIPHCKSLAILNQDGIALCNSLRTCDNKRRSSCNSQNAYIKPSNYYEQSSTVKHEASIPTKSNQNTNNGNSSIILPTKNGTVFHLPYMQKKFNYYKKSMRTDKCYSATLLLSKSMKQSLILNGKSRLNLSPAKKLIAKNLKVSHNLTKYKKKCHYVLPNGSIRHIKRNLTSRQNSHMSIEVPSFTTISINGDLPFHNVPLTHILSNTGSTENTDDDTYVSRHNMELENEIERQYRYCGGGGCYGEASHMKNSTHFKKMRPANVHEMKQLYKSNESRGYNCLQFPLSLNSVDENID